MSISNHKFQYYPELDDKDFYKKIYLKKEFNQYKIPKNKNINIENECNPKSFNLLNQQNLLRNYISYDTPYNGVLIIHGTGTGKTCTAISIAENFRNSINIDKNPKILVILGKSIIDNFYKEIYNLEREEKKIGNNNVQCTGKKYQLNEEDNYLTYEQKQIKINKKIKENYILMGYEKFANFIKKNTLWDGNEKNLDKQIIDWIKKYFSNRVIIIDEVHNIKTTSSSDLKKVPPILKIVVKYSDNLRLVLMSATPMFDSSKEIIYLINLLLENDRRPLLKVNEIFNKDELTKKGEMILSQALTGYVSYLRGEKPYYFPYRIYPKEAIIPKIKYNIKHGEIPKSENINFQKLILCPMSDYQYLNYKHFLGVNINKLNNKNNNEVNSNFKSQGTNIIQISNICYPLRDGNATYGSSGFQLSDNGLGAFFIKNMKSTFTKKNKSFINYQNHVIFNKGTINEKPFLDLDYIDVYSSKMKFMLDKIINSNGLVFIYSEFKASGIFPIALALEQNGIERYVLNNEDQLLDYPTNSKKGGGKSAPICYYCGKKATNKIHKVSTPNYHKFYTAKYAILSGSSNIIDLGNININKITNIYNSSNNKYGSEIKILLGTRVTGEGIDLKRIRQLFIFDPWHNLSRIEQIIGRAIRWCSHYDLPPESRNVEIYKLCSTAPKNASKIEKETESIDERRYRLSELKDKNIKKIERILKKSAFDCFLFKNNNIITNKNKEKQITASGNEVKIENIDNPYSRNCDYEKICEYKCNWEPNKNEQLLINKDTYNLNFARTEINNSIEIIKKMYKKDILYNLNSIINEIKKIHPEIEERFILKGLDNLVGNKKEILNDKYNRNGYLIYRGDYYIFQPLDYKDERIPILYRKKPILKTKEKIDLTDIKLENNINENKNISNIDVNKLIKNIISDFKSKKMLIENLVKIKDYKYYKPIILDIILNEYNNNELLLIFKHILKKKKNNFDELILNTLENKIYKLNNKIKVFKLNSEYYIINSKDIIEADDKSKRKIILYLKDKNKDINLSSIYGLIKNKLFKIIDLSKSKNAITKDNKISKRTEIRGRVCKTNKISDLLNIYKLLTGNSIIKIRKNVICFLIEFILRYYDLIKKNNKKWIIYN